MDMSERFWAKVEVRGGDECWPWKAGLLEGGYGQFAVNRVPTSAHRVAFFLANGYWPVVGRHTCDNPPCCNPNHVVDGTHEDNMKDMVSRGRSSRKLTDRQVALLRSLERCANHGTLAALFGISAPYVSRLLSGKRRV